MSDQTPPLYLLTTLKLYAGKVEQFCAVMPKVVAIAEGHGWQLVGSWGHIIGRLNGVIDLWRVPDANAVPSGFAALMQHLDWPEISRELAECIEDEVLQLMARMPFDPGRV